MKMKRAVSLVFVVIMVFAVSVTAFAAPYQNYTVTESGAYQEPQAYVPDVIVDSGVIGLENLEGTAMLNPSDLVQFKYNESIIISDTGNNRVIVLDKDLKTVKQIIKTWTNGTEEDSFNSPNGMFIYAPEDLLYICDTNNKRVVRFAFDREEDLFVFDRTFDDPDISQYLSDDMIIPEDEEKTPSATEVPTATEMPAETEAPAETEPPAENEGGAETPAEATPAPSAGTGSGGTVISSGGSSAADITYTPLKIVVDNSMRMFVVSKDCYQGLVELNKDGEFTKFYGATRTKQTLSSFLSRIFTAEAKSLMQQNLSTEYSNVTLDSEGFIYGTISQLKVEDLASHFQDNTEIGAALRKLNAAGSDVLQRQGIVPPSGDMGDAAERSTYSYIVDVTVSENGLASILDSQKGRVFTYTSTGELLYVFGALGQRQNNTGSLTNREEQVGFTKGTSLSPSAIELLADDQTLVVLDSGGAQLTTYIPTEYGMILRTAVNSHEERRYDEAVEAWQKILGMSSNSVLAYNGIGKVYYMDAAEELDSTLQKETYLKAAEYFKKGYSQEEYGKAFYKYRDKVLEEIMPYMMTGIIVLVVVLLLWGWYKRLRRFIKTGGKDV